MELVEQGGLDFIAFECLAERTIARETLAVRRGQGSGYNPQLEDRMRAVLPPAAARGVRVLSNMGAADPLAAGRRTSEIAGDLGLARPALRGAAGRRRAGCRRRPAGPPVDGDRRAAGKHPAPHGVGERLSRRGRRGFSARHRGAGGGDGPGRRPLALRRTHRPRARLGLRRLRPSRPGHGGRASAGNARAR